MLIRYIIKERLASTAAADKYQVMPVREFVGLIGARSSLPGGGCVAALAASLGSALACMAGQLTYGNRKFERLDAEIRQLLPAFYTGYNELMQLIDQDALAFTAYVVRVHSF